MERFTGLGVATISPSRRIMLRAEDVLNSCRSAYRSLNAYCAHMELVQAIDDPVCDTHSLTWIADLEFERFRTFIWKAEGPLGRNHSRRWNVFWVNGVVTGSASEKIVTEFTSVEAAFSEGMPIARQFGLLFFELHISENDLRANLLVPEQERIVLTCFQGVPHYRIECAPKRPLQSGVIKSELKVWVSCASHFISSIEISDHFSFARRIRTMTLQSEESREIVTAKMPART